jgi:prolyl 4-hydroxylase
MHPLVEQANQAMAGGRTREAATLLNQAASEEDRESQFLLALWRIKGNIIQRDLSEARRLLGQAAESGHHQARLIHCYFLGSGTGGPVLWKEAVSELTALTSIFPALAQQRDLISKMSLDEEGNPTALPVSMPLCASPEARSAAGFATQEECSYLVDISEPWLAPARVIDPKTGRDMQHPDRISDSALIGVVQEDLVVSAINRRIATFSETDQKQAEALQIIRYKPGGEYRPHTDAFPQAENQRIVTVLIYLTANYKGGETKFTRTGVTFKGKLGDALMFKNVDSNGYPDLMAEHAGVPVRSGVKIIASRWIRERPFAFPPPIPLLSGF